MCLLCSTFTNSNRIVRIALGPQGDIVVLRPAPETQDIVRIDAPMTCAPLECPRSHLANSMALSTLPQSSVYRRLANGTWQLAAELESEPFASGTSYSYYNAESVAISGDGLVVVTGTGSYIDSTVTRGQAHIPAHNGLVALCYS
jgi:hypothetical protein